MKYLRDIIGPCKGQIRPYLDHTAAHAIDSGFAVAVSDAEVRAWFDGDDPPPVSVQGETTDGQEMEVEAPPIAPEVEVKAEPVKRGRRRKT